MKSTFSICFCFDHFGCHSSNHWVFSQSPGPQLRDLCQLGLYSQHLASQTTNRGGRCWIMMIMMIMIYWDLLYPTIDPKWWVDVVIMGLSCQLIACSSMLAKRRPSAPLRSRHWKFCEFGWKLRWDHWDHWDLRLDQVVFVISSLQKVQGLLLYLWKTHIQLSFWPLWQL